MAARLLGFFIVCVAFFGAAAMAAQQSIVLRDAARPVPLSGPGVWALQDPGQQLSLDDVLEHANAFVPATSLPPVYTLTTRWYRFTLLNGAPSVQWYVAVTPYTRSAELYFPKAGGGYGVARFGGDIPYAQRPDSGELPATAITPSLFGKTLYLRVTGDFGVGTVPAIRSAKLLDPYDKAAAGSIIGFLYAMCVASLLLALRLRSPLYFWTALLLFFSASNEATARFLTPEYVWPAFSIPLRLANNVLNASMYVMFYVQARAFLEAPYRPKWYEVSLIPLTVIVAADLGRFVLPVPSLAISDAAAVMLFAVCITACALWAWRRGYHAARFFLLGFAPFSAGAILQMLSLAGFPGSLVQWLPPLGVAWYAAMLQLALADRILLMSSDRESALSQLAAERQNVIRTQDEALQELEAHNQAFARFVPSDFLHRLGRKDIVNVELGDHAEREMAVLFCDIRSFTTLSERLSPEENFTFVNGYFARVGPIVRAYGGFIDKFVGDAVMALFDEPKQALDAAIALQQEVRRFNEARARQFLQPIEVGIGTHFGALMLGTVGEENRMETTVISSAVNVASRMESLTKQFGAAILVTEALLENLPDGSAYTARCLGSVQVKGLERPIAVYEICDADVPEIMLAKIAAKEQFAQAVAAFEAGDHEKAQALFSAIAQSEPRDRAARYYLERIRLEDAGAHMPL